MSWNAGRVQGLGTYLSFGLIHCVRFRDLGLQGKKLVLLGLRLAFQGFRAILGSQNLRLVE